MTDIKQWVQDRRDEMLKDIKFYISEGFEKGKAIEMVLDGSTVGAGIKAQIRYEVKSM